MTPLRRSIMWDRTALQAMKVVVKFDSITSRHSSSVMSKTVTEWVRSLVKRRYPPALLTRISIFPSSLMVSRTARLAPSLVVSSALTVWERRPRPRISEPTASSSEGVRATMATSAPSRA